MLSRMKFPAIHSQVHHTAAGTPYLREPGIVLIAQPQVDLSGLRGFLEGFDPELEFPAYLDDPVQLPPAEQLVKVAGQLCYASFGPKRTLNERAQAYLDHIKESGHGSVCEHANFTFLLYGVDRALTHELVRHRAGVAISQLSQRFVDGKVLRFVERPEYQGHPHLHERFELWIDLAAEEYRIRTEILLELQGDGVELLSDEDRTGRRKKVQQASRSCLPNETEAPIIITPNARALRHIIEMRGAGAADIPIRLAAMGMLEVMQQLAPMLFSDYDVVQHTDGTQVASTKWRKV